MPTPINPITQGSYWIVTPSANFLSKAYGNLNGVDLFFYVSQTLELCVVNFNTNTPGNTTFVLVTGATWVGTISLAGIVHVYYADLSGQLWYIPYIHFGATIVPKMLGIGSIVTFSVTYTPQSIPPAFMCMTNDGVSHNLFVATDPMFEAQISSIKTYNNSFNTSIYVTNPVIAMHPSDTKNLTVHVQQIVVLSSVSSVGWYVVEVPGLA